MHIETIKKRSGHNWGRLSLAQKAALAQNLSVMLKAGMSLTEALATLGEQSRGRVKALVATLLERVSSGNSLSDALQPYHKDFSYYFINTIKAGEASGTLEESLFTLTEKMNRDKDLADKVRLAMVYPALILSLSACLAALLAFVVLPKITPIFSGLNIDLPLSTKALIYLANSINKRGGTILFGLALFLSGGGYVIRHRVLMPIRHWLYLKLPVIRGISQNKNLAQCFGSLGALIRSGIGLDEALAISGESIGNYYYRRALTKLQTGLQSGQSLTESMLGYRRLFPVLAINMVRVGERSGQLEEQFFSLAEIYEQKTIRATKLMSTFIEPALLVFIGLVVGWLAISIIAPIYQITGNIYK